MGVTALYRKTNTSQRHPEHSVYPYLLRHLSIERANHVWTMDITYLPMERGFIYLAVVMDWATRVRQACQESTQTSRCSSAT